MKKMLAAAVVTTLALAGCSAGNQSADATPSATATHSASTSAEPAALSEADIAKAKQSAIDSGRPENAWNKNCIAWQWPEAKTKGQAWANELGKEWLKYRGVDCPDAIVVPFYDITSFEPGKNGELVVNYSGDPQWDGEGLMAAQEIMADLSKLDLDPKMVVVRYEQNGLEMTSGQQ
ncbi:hypothetical protein ACFQ4U_10455 [Micrococcus antarcticus]